MGTTFAAPCRPHVGASSKKAITVMTARMSLLSFLHELGLNSRGSAHNALKAYFTILRYWALSRVPRGFGLRVLYRVIWDNENRMETTFGD